MCSVGLFGRVGHLVGIVFGVDDRLSAADTPLVVVMGAPSPEPTDRSDGLLTRGAHRFGGPLGPLGPLAAAQGIREIDPAPGPHTQGIHRTHRTHRTAVLESARARRRHPGP
jgi:hypothetical protein